MPLIPQIPAGSTSGIATALQVTCARQTCGAAERRIMTIAVLGAGAWGTAIAINLAGRPRVTLWARDATQAAAMRAAGANERYLPGFRFPAGLQVEADFGRATANCDYLILAAPVSGLREVSKSVLRSSSARRTVPPKPATLS